MEALRSQQGNSASLNSRCVFTNASPRKLNTKFLPLFVPLSPSHLSNPAICWSSHHWYPPSCLHPYGTIIRVNTLGRLTTTFITDSIARRYNTYTPQLDLPNIWTTVLQSSAAGITCDVIRIKQSSEDSFFIGGGESAMTHTESTKKGCIMARS